MELPFRNAAALPDPASPQNTPAQGSEVPEVPALWDPAALAGRLVEIVWGRPADAEPPADAAAEGRAANIWDVAPARDVGSAALTVASSLVWKAQQLGEPVAWIAARISTFFPPDLDAAGIDLASLVVVRAPDAPAAARAADKLLRSGAFGLVVVDLGEHAAVPVPLLSRLLGLAQKHHAAVVFLTEKAEDAPSLAPIVSLRVSALRRRSGIDRFVCSVEARKDKRRAPGWSFEESFRGPPGLR